MANIVVPLVFLGVIVIVAMMMPLFTTMNVPVSDGLELADLAYKVFRNNTVDTHNVTADSAGDTMFLLEGDGIDITNFFANDTIRITATGAGGGEANTGTNVGGQTGQVFRDKSGVTLNFKTISGSGGISITNNANDIDIGLGALNMESLNNVTNTGCAVGEILKVVGTTWQCATDNSGSGSDIISEGNSNVEVIDAGVGQVDIDIDGTNEFTFTDGIFSGIDSDNSVLQGFSIGHDGFSNHIHADVVHVEVRNEAGITLNKGDAVYVSGYSVGSDLALVGLADSSSSATMPAFGIVASASIGNNADGMVYISGKLEDVNTGSWTAGDVLYISNVGTSGNTLTNVKPTGTDLIEQVGEVLRSHASNGRMEVELTGVEGLPNVAEHDLSMGSNAITNADLSSSTNTFPNLEQLNNVTSTGCAVGEILKVSGTTWQCATDGGSGINDINGDSASSQTLSGTTNQITVTDTGVGALQWDVGTDIVQIDQANTYADGNLQTFTDDDIRIQDNTGGQFYTISTGDISADRVVSIPVMTTNGVFVITDTSQTLTNKGIDLSTNTVTGTFAEFNTAVSDATLVDLDDSQTLTNKDLSSTTNTYGNLEQMNNVTNTGCAVGEILKVVGTTWQCATDNGGGGNTDLLDGSVHQDTVAQAVTRGSLIYGDATPNWNELVIGGAGTILKSDGTDVSWGTGTLGTEITGTMENLSNVTNTGCAVGEILKVVGTTWQCATDGGSGINDINGDSASSQTLSGTANQITVTDTGVGTLQWDVGSDIVQIDQANSYTDGNLQTFTDDDIEISNPAGTFQYILSTNAIVADRTVTFPLLTGNDVFTMQSASQTLTNKGVDLSTNTVSGTTAQFNTANSDGTFVTIENTHTYSDGIKQTFNPDATNAGINVGSHTAEPSSPAVGDIFYDSTAGTLKGYDGVWQDLMQGGGGSNALLDGTAHTDTVAQGVTRGSLIYGDATPNWNELVIGGANTVLKSDGTDISWSALTLGTEVTGTMENLSNVTNTGCAVGEILKVVGTTWQCATDGGSGINDINGDSASSQTLSGTANQITVTDTGVGTLQWDVGSDIVQIDQANAYTDTNMQTFTDDDIEIRNPANTFDYIFSTSAIVADRTVSLPLLTTNDVFTFNTASQTLTNKGIDLSANTVTGTFAEFNTAVSDATLVDLDDSQTLTNKDLSSTTNTYGNLEQMNNVTNTGCAVGEILKVVGTTWQCATDNGGGGNTDLLDGSVHQDTVAQAVTRGSLIYGDATPNWNELVIGGANTMLISDGTDVSWGTGTLGSHVTGASTSLTDTANIAYLNTANTWTSGTQDFGSLTIQGFDLDCDGTGNSCTNVDTADFIGVAEPKSATFTCGAGQPQVTASPPKATIDGTNLDYVVCDYSDAVTERLIWTYEMPTNMDSAGNIDVTVHFTTTGTAGVCWDVAFMPKASGEAVTSGTFSALSGGCDSATVTGNLEQASITGITSATHGIVGGDTVFIKLERDFADATDTNTADARMISFEMEWN